MGNSHGKIGHRPGSKPQIYIFECGHFGRFTLCYQKRVSLLQFLNSFFLLACD